MVTRKSHSRKEKKAMATFGQFILPLAVVMAAALMFFSVKLFFLDPHDVKITDNTSVSVNNLHTEPGLHQTDSDLEKIIKEQEAPEKNGVKKPVEGNTKKTNAVVSQKKAAAKNEPKKSELKKSEPKNNVVKTPVKPAVLPQKQPQTSKLPVTESKSAARWDVQIGGFSAKEGALETLRKARGEGYSVYISESTMNDKPFYKVRVRGFSEKKDAAKLASEIEAKGYPVYLVYNK